MPNNQNQQNNVSQTPQANQTQDLTTGDVYITEKNLAEILQKI